MGLISVFFSKGVREGGEYHVKSKTKNVFSTEEAYVEFEDKVFRFIGAMQIPVEEAAFEKGVECGIYLAKQGISL